MEIREITPEDQRLAILMQKAQLGDSEAYVRLLEQIAPRLRRFVRGRWRLSGTEDVEDIVQDVLLSMHSVRATYDPQRPFMPWLMAIVRNRIADSGRRYAHHEGREVHVENWDVTFSAESANSTTEGYGDLAVLRQAIQRLPAGQRSAIEMLKLRGMSLREAAAACGVSIGSLKTATHRAMNALRKKLLKEG